MMKIRIEIDENLKDEVVIRSRTLDANVRNIQQAVMDAISIGQKLVFYKDDTEYYLPLGEILFYETEGNVVYAHTKHDIFSTKYRLYELEELLPGFFMRVSKSTILNTKYVYAITKSISTTCLVQLQGTHKQVYVSRYYYKPLRERLEEKR